MVCGVCVCVVCAYGVCVCVVCVCGGVCVWCVCGVCVVCVVVVVVVLVVYGGGGELSASISRISRFRKKHEYFDVTEIKCRELLFGCAKIKCHCTRSPPIGASISTNFLSQPFFK